LYKVRFEPLGRQATFDRPLTILQAAQNAGVEMLALCGGQGTCARCRVKVRGDGMPPVCERERGVFNADELAEGYRLACRTTICSDVVVVVPEVSRPRRQRLQVAGQEHPVTCCPPVRKVCLQLPEPTLEDTRDDLRRLVEAGREDHGIKLAARDVTALAQLGPAARRGNWLITAALRGRDLIGVEPGDRSGNVHGVAVDLGSTKIAVYLVDLLTGVTSGSSGVPNPQIAYGEDIVSRITYALDSELGAQRLQGVVVDALNGAVAMLCDSAGIVPEDVLEFTVVGNTAMHHLFLGLPTAQLSRAPFVPVAASPLEVTARSLGLRGASGAIVYCPPCVAGFVGSDHVAMVLASRMAGLPGTVLGIDIGTNTEISLKHNARLQAVSCASGPAFEGAALCWGVKAAPGAIERVWIDPDSHAVHAVTIDGQEPVGICGSGILDCVAGMLQAGMLDRNGHVLGNSPAIRLGADGLRELVVARSANGAAITVSQRDVERIQLAKGAIRSGIDVLLDAAGIAWQDIDATILAGAFGTFIDPLSAIRIGMLPPVDPDCIVQVGNAAGVGAKEVLISMERRHAYEELAETIEYLELTVYPRYSRVFARSLRF